MRSIETEAGTIDEAIERALEALQVTRDKVELEILEYTTRGLLGLGGKRARVRATIRVPRAMGEAVGAEDLVSRGTPGELNGAPADVVDPVRAVLERILSALGVDVPVEVRGPTEDGLTLELIGQDTGIVIGRHGQTLDAIEYLLNRIVAQRGRTSIRISVDVEGYRERRRESLELTARRLAAQAKKTGRPESLSPMSPRDRRIVHLALSEDEGVTTRSEGEGSYRRVVIIPSRSAGRARSGA
ncbi:MAG TPA: RNA-binding cell elongation regulator Jag/EloR [Candidatus Eisenbacteria bacterium]|nr:RNA-binding cell elongation regulator Jag/EloR [Candidatus Eisenbacteria bacterium]